MQSLNGQSESVITRQYILHLSQEASLSHLIEGLQRRNYNIDMIEYRRIMQEPLNLWLIQINGDFAKVKAIKNELADQPEVIGVSANRYISERRVPDDPDFPRQWQYINDGSSGGVVNADMDMDLAWDLSTGGLTASGDTIVVCIIDSGINAGHPDLKDNLWVNRQEIPGNGLDDDNNGYVDDVLGWNAVDGNDVVNNNSNHGSSVAGIVGAKGNNGIGVAGVNWNVKMMIVNYGRPTEANALASYAYPYTMRKLYNQTNGVQGAFVVATNASWGIDRLKAEEAPIWCALYDSLGQVGIINCGATANAGVNVDEEGDMPTSCESEFLISVTNLDRSDVKVAGAGFGYKSIDLGAYGQLVYTTTANAYGTFGGTSAATPHVAGTIGLMYATQCNMLSAMAKNNPAGAALVVKDMLLHGVVPNNSLKNITTTGGRLNAHRALQNIIKLCENCAPPSGISAENTSEGVKISWSGFTGSAMVKIRYRREGTDTWQEIANIENGAILRGLEVCQVYEYQIGANCGLLPGDYSYSKYFKTSSCCLPPKDIRVFASEKELDVNFELPELYSSFVVEYRDFEGTWNPLSATSGKITLSELYECNYYELRVRTVCETTGAESDFSVIIAATTSCGACTEAEYCEIKNIDATQEWIESIKIDGTLIRTGKSRTGYGYHLGVGNIVFRENTTSQIEITPGFAGQTFEEYYKVFVDLNFNGIWEAEELLYFNASGIRGPVTGTVFIPALSAEGYTRMRIIMTYDTFPGACTHPRYEFGETEDYCVFLKKKSCIAISRVQVTDVEKFTATIQLLTDGIFPDSVKLNVKNTVSGNDLDFIVKEGQIRLTALDSCTEYLYIVQTFCNGVPEGAVITGGFKTLCASSVNDPFSPDKISIIPNPVSHTLRIHIPANYGPPDYFRLLSYDGRVIHAVYELKSPQDMMVDMSEFLPGVYILECAIKNSKYSFRVIRI